MTDANEITMIPTDQITILNPRARNKRIFKELVTSIRNLGLKKPITVSRRENGYDLVCGQGRLEALVELGQTHIPAIVVQASQEDCFVMSLVENLARRQHSSLELLHEINALIQRGYSVTEIAAKTDFSIEYITAIRYLLEHGEDRLLTAVERGVMPHSVAMEIARAKDGDIQNALADAYEANALPGKQVLAIRRIIEQRNSIGKGLQSGRAARSRKPVTAIALIRSYQKETGRQKLMVKKANLAQSRLLFVVNAMRRLFKEEHFVALLRAERIATMPRLLADRLTALGRQK